MDSRMRNSRRKYKIESFERKLFAEATKVKGVLAQRVYASFSVCTTDNGSDQHHK